MQINYLNSLQASVKRVPQLPPKRKGANLICRASQEVQTSKKISQQIAGVGAAAMLSLGCLNGSALASEYDLLSSSTPTINYVIDDANVLSRSARGELQKKLFALENSTGYRLEVATTRKLETEPDAFAFGDKVIESWYPTPELGDKKGILLVVTTGKDGALTGGKSFMTGVGDDLIDSIITTNIPIFTEEEKYNECVLSTVNRIEAVLSGQQDPGAPSRNVAERKRTYKTKTETEKTRFVTATIVGTLLFIAVVVPMLQYYGYVSKD
eukprot:TRINITY_DN6400_c0_g1_i1.p1 TRINITY_DN6400_c0_g1~~TRINITY_DN6400_c0_g1_i1.p1  ORF type:complete len:268 (+),score=33.85 TRINITY_DN6400_c0_g1_i1:154-957(+)